VKRCDTPAELWGVTVNNAAFLPWCHVLVDPARPGSARLSHSLLPAPSRMGPRHSPCSESSRVPSQRLRALACPGRCRGPGCSAQQHVGSRLPSPGLSQVHSSEAHSCCRLQGCGALISIHVYQLSWSAGPKVQLRDGAVVGPAPHPWTSWQGESGVQSFDLDGVGSIPAIPPTQFTCFIDEFNKLA
jgi:hypothetical protein